jgi:hypothetical protein
MATTSPRPRRWRLSRVLLGGALAGFAAILGLWIAVNRVEWLGPIVADSLRAVIGVEAVASLEDFAYAQQDRFNRFWRTGEQPKAHWDIPAPAPEQPPAPVTGPSAGKPSRPRLPPFQPANVGPALESWSAPGDGQWVAVASPDAPESEPYMMKTLLHPDKHRSWAEVFVIAIDLRRVAVHLVAGSREPKATEAEALELDRPGVIPVQDRPAVLAAFNGGFKTEHGQYGMRLDGITYVRPKAGVCAIVKLHDGALEIATWETLADREDRMLWWRQTPNCMVEDGKIHPRLLSEKLSKRWGATLDGETVIRRSAVGISADGRILFASISNHTTAQVIAEGVRHAGAATVAQTDVNFSYPKFVTFERKSDLAEGEPPKRIAVPLADGFEFSEDEYIRKKASRDFFYVMPLPEHERTAQNGGS